jgi:hypothetical protein
METTAIAPAPEHAVAEEPKRMSDALLAVELERVFGSRGRLAGLKAEVQSLIDEAMPEEVATNIADIQEEFKPQLDAIAKDLATLEKKLKEEVKERGEKFVGVHLQLVYSKGSEKVDIAGLKGYAKVHPEVLDFITPGTPSTTIRKVAKKK